MTIMDHSYRHKYTKTLLLHVLTGMSLSCGPRTEEVNERTTPETSTSSTNPGCSVLETTVGADVTCGGNTVTIARGVDGAAGTSGAVGTSGPAGADGQDGQDGAAGQAGPAGTDAPSCLLSTTAEGVKITCGDQIAEVKNGQDGQNGADGAPGVDGQDGAPGEQGEAGPAGPQGVSGSNGLDGRNGSDGVDGSDGLPGTPGIPGSLITPIIPCPNKPGSFPEVLLCIDNKLYAVFVGGTGGNAKEVRYSQIPAGNYMTTDGRSCAFHVTNTCNLEY